MIDQIKTILNMRATFYVILSLIVLLVVGLIVTGIRKVRVKRLFASQEARFNQVKGVPLLFKLNKANGLAKINKDVIDQVEAAKAEFERIQSCINQVGTMLADSEDYIVDGKVGKGRKLLEQTGPIMDQLDLDIAALGIQLDALLEQESQLRIVITNYKDEFRVLKNTFNHNLVALSLAETALQSVFEEIEQDFSAFEEWMFATEFEKARELAHEIRLTLDDLKVKLATMPGLIEKAKLTVPGKIDQVSDAYQDAKGRGVFLDHLEVSANMTAISETLRSDLSLLKLAKTDGVGQHLLDSGERLDQLLLDIQRERKAHEEIDAMAQSTFVKLHETSASLNKLTQDIPVIIARFNFPNFEENVTASALKCDELLKLQSKLQRMMNEESIPASTLRISLESCRDDVDGLAAEVEGYNKQIELANSDENRARKQILKLYLILNDIQMRIKKHHIPSFSEKYQEDLNRSYQYISGIQKLLDEPILNVTILNASVNEAIDYIYKLHNNVNNLIGVVSMCENAIVYANKYRSTFADINADLNHAEISFRNGEYTQALTTIITAIDRHQPGISHEKFIKENAQSA